MNKVPEQTGEVINPETEDLAAWLGRDPQLQKGLDLLKTFNIFKGPVQEASAPPVAQAG
jgi:hypothetical protein